MIRFRRWQTVCTLLFLGFTISSPAHALFRVGPVITYEVFKRTYPENANVVRFGAGANFGVEIIPDRLVFETWGFYISEETGFATTDTLNETIYRGRLGPFITLIGGSALRLGLRGGVQYDKINDEYFLQVRNQRIQSTNKIWTQYIGLGLELIPFAGFGVQLGVTTWRDKRMDSWVPEVSLGILLN